jgi:hypothetical protein
VKESMSETVKTMAQRKVHDEKRCRERERVPGGCMLDVGFLTRDQFYHYIYTALFRAIRRFACLQSSKSHETERPGMRVAA